MIASRGSRQPPSALACTPAPEPEKWCDSVILGMISGMNVTRMPQPPVRGFSRADLLGQFESLDGRRANVAAVEGPRYDRRIVGEMYESGGFPWVNVATERDWWKAALMGEGLPRLAWPAGCVWVEDAPLG